MLYTRLYIDIQASMLAAAVVQVQRLCCYSRQAAGGGGSRHIVPGAYSPCCSLCDMVRQRYMI